MRPRPGGDRLPAAGSRRRRLTWQAVPPVPGESQFLLNVPDGCHLRLSVASLPVVAAPPRPGGPRKILAVDRAAPGKGQRMSPRPLSTTRDITREHLGTQSGRSHRRFGLHPSLPAAGRQLRGGEGRTAQEAVARGPQVRRRPGFGREPLRMSVLKRGCAVSLFPLRFAPSNSCQRLRKAAARSSLSSCECPLKHVVLLWQQVQNKGAHACSKATQHSRIRASLCLAPAAEGSKVLRQEDKSS